MFPEVADNLPPDVRLVTLVVDTDVGVLGRGVVGR